MNVRFEAYDSDLISFWKITSVVTSILESKKQNHNLIRARTQLALTSNIYKQISQLNEIVERIVNS